MFLRQPRDPTGAGVALLAAFAVAIKLETPGPVFFGQRRMGR
jgi:lipopolysaccharide/colanic/teichoic acid biosynthesis glycosyltransferase